MPALQGLIPAAAKLAVVDTAGKKAGLVCLVPLNRAAGSGIELGRCRIKGHRASNPRWLSKRRGLKLSAARSVLSLWKRISQLHSGLSVLILD
jgi:hypothetical protein